MSAGCWRCRGYLVVYPYWLGYHQMASGLLEDYGLEPAEHPDVALELDQAIGETIIDTLMDVLRDYADKDPRIASALACARGEDDAVAAPAQGGEGSGDA